MPNHPTLAGAMVIASLALAAAIAVYESPQARQLAEDLRRKIAVALHSLGNEIDPAPSDKEPRFNRPEDAEGFMLSKGHTSGAYSEADEKLQRRQREELFYWNAVKIALEEKELDFNRRNSASSSKHEFFLGISSQNCNQTSCQDISVSDSGSNVAHVAQLNLRKPRRTHALGYSNFSDHNDHVRIKSKPYEDPLITQETETQEKMSNIYEATDFDLPSASESNSQKQVKDLKLLKISDSDNIYASIHAWAETAHSKCNPNMSSFSVTSMCPSLSKNSYTPKIESSSTLNQVEDLYTKGSGNTTPTDIFSLVGSTNHTLEPQSYNNSEDEAAELISLNGGSSFAGTWTEVASVISENDSF
ncbi:hypothetical protein GcM1_241016 [Golovinomyces cichoracearum]|uniref:Uncharacterized protein n=1 Tax=Golovinomyces cichoracearum TaxID=62708 RepID=A0A420IHE5_9PEZI|nr:hypothetical protein GcM1_241016 [Golovinomyces cichoracearum]